MTNTPVTPSPPPPSHEEEVEEISPKDKEKVPTSSSSSASIQPKKEKVSRASLPLGWTKIKRQKRAPSSSSPSSSSKDDFYYCNDENCRKPHLFTSPPPLSSQTTQAEEEEEMITLKGRAIFCLHDINCTWFQGHFFASSSFSTAIKSTGILVTKRNDVDDCLVCQEGGYNEYDVTLFVLKNGKRKEVKLERVVGTGGDMMRLRSSNATAPNNKAALLQSHPQNNGGLSFDADTVLCGQNTKVRTLLRKYFSSLIRTIQQDGKEKEQRHCTMGSDGEKNDDDVLDLIPNVAIVQGDMMVQVSKRDMSLSTARTSNGLGKSKMKNNDDDDNDDWMSD